MAQKRSRGQPENLETLDGQQEAVELAPVDPGTVKVPSPAGTFVEIYPIELAGDAVVREQPPAWAQTLLQAVRGLAQRMEVVESLAARQSVPPPQPVAQPVDPAATQNNLREAMWAREHQRLQGQQPTPFIGEKKPLPNPRPKQCERCKTEKPAWPSRFCIPCQQVMHANRCERCDNILPDDGPCAVCSQEGSEVESIRPGPRFPVGEYTQETVEIISEGFPA